MPIHWASIVVFFLFASTGHARHEKRSDFTGWKFQDAIAPKNFPYRPGFVGLAVSAGRCKKVFNESGGKHQLWPDNQLDLFDHNNNKALTFSMSFERWQY